MYRSLWLVLIALGTLTGPQVQAQEARNEQFYFPGSFNWQFLDRYPEGGRLFNAFDYGHAVLYEKLYTRPADLAGELETRQFDYLTTDLLVLPPRFAVAEEAIEPNYARLAWRAKMMFDWAHLLHRQIYDIYADPRLSRPEQDRLIERVTDYYLSNQRLAFSAKPKAMSLMDDQYYSQVFRHGYPKFNGLIWAYHWLQVGLYEPLIQGATAGEKKAGVQTTIARFWTMLKDAPDRFPKVMPMTPVVAPLFTAAHPRAAIIFDNLHMTHDIISDILAADTVPASKKRAVIYAALDEMQDTTRNVMSPGEWRNMGEMMGGVGIMGGPATGILSDPPTLSAPHTGMVGMGHVEQDHGTAAMPCMGSPDTRGHPMMDMSGMGIPGTVGDSSMTVQMRLMMAMHSRMMADPVIRQRIMADTAMVRMMREMMVHMPADEQARMMELMKPGAGPSAHPKGGHPPPKKPPATIHDSMPGMSMPHDSTHH